MLIEELILFDKLYLAEAKLIFGHYKKQWLAVLVLPFLGIGAALFIALYSSSYILKPVCLALMFLCLFWSFYYSRGKTLSILQMHAQQCNLCSSDIWRNRYVVIRKIQLHKLGIYLSSHNCNNTEAICYITEVLKEEQQYPKYKYQFLQIFLTLFSVVVAAFFTAMVAVPKMFYSWESVVLFFKPIVGVSLLFIVVFWFCEFMLIREFFEMQRSKYKRLIRLLENRYMQNNVLHKKQTLDKKPGSRRRKRPVKIKYSEA